jgi:hypothetical protein
MHLKDALASRSAEFRPARSEARSLDSNFKIMFDPFRLSLALWPFPGSMERSGESASRIEIAIRLDLAEMTI